jgi:hypothetical protein
MLLITNSLVVAKFRDRLSVSKQAAQKFNVERLSLKKLNEVKGGTQYQPKISNSVGSFGEGR